MGHGDCHQETDAVGQSGTSFWGDDRQGRDKFYTLYTSFFLEFHAVRANNFIEVLLEH